MKKTLFKISLSIGLVSAFYGVYTFLNFDRNLAEKGKSSKSEKPELFDAFQFSFKTRSQGEQAFDSLRGNLVLIHFWAAWCAPCVEELPNILEFARKFESKKVKILTISLDRTWEESDKVMPSQGLPNNLIQALDAESKISNLYGSYQYPETFLISQKGKILMKWIGPQDWNQPQFQEVIDRHLSGAFD